MSVMAKYPITATDLEVEMKTVAQIECDEIFDFTIPARKLLDICKALPEEAQIQLEIKGDKALLRSGRSRFTLGILPAQDYPSIEPTASSHRFSVSQKTLKQLIEKSHFAMAQQDVRYYLNGMLIEVKSGIVRTVATDGHRLAMSEMQCQIDSDVTYRLYSQEKR